MAYGWVLQFSHYQEGPLYLEYVLLLHYKLLHRVGIVVSLVPASKNAAISSLPQFLQKFVLVEEGVVADEGIIL